jgi:hypothetical protein
VTPTEQTHAVIAGTGRAGTSFLVRFLAGCGVPAGDLDALKYFPDARAGLERNLLEAPDVYLVKDPSFHEYLDEIDQRGISIDIVILPVRDLRAAAASRVRQERAARSTDPVRGNYSTGGAIAGGILYSLSPVDQERILAVGQARVVSWCLARSVPLVLLHYPRLVREPPYLVDSLQPWLGQFCSRDEAITVAAELADPREWADDGAPWMSDEQREWDAERHGLRFALDRLRATVQELQAEVQDRQRMEASLRAELTRASGREEQARAQDDLAQAEARERLDEITDLRREIGALRNEIDRLTRRHDQVLASRSLRIGRMMTSPARSGPFAALLRRRRRG